MPANVFSKNNEMVGGLPGEALKETGLEKEILGLLPNSARVQSVSGAQWEIERHPGTGLPLRKTTSAIVSKAFDERCFYEYHSFAKEYEGTDYGNLAVTWGGKAVDMPCGCFE